MSDDNQRTMITKGIKPLSPSPDLSTAETIPPVSGSKLESGSMEHTPEVISKSGQKRTLGPYEILSFLGKGGMGTVYKAMDRSLQRTVAIKELAPQIAQRAELVQRFLREARLVAKLNHPNICDIYYLGMDQEKRAPFYAMEYVDGQSMEELMKRKGLIPAKEASSLILQTAQALNAAWKEKILHRDIKPANLMITRNGVIKVTDFGLAKLLEEDQGLTKDNIIMGTPIYMSPEAARGEKVDFRSDQYSLGVTFYHLLSGQPPFNGPTTMSVLQKHLFEPPPPLASLCKGIDENTVTVVSKMMEKNADDRFQNYDELIAALSKSGASSPSESTIASSSPPKGGKKDEVAMDTDIENLIKKSTRMIKSAGESAASAARVVAPRISLKRRWKIKLGFSILFLLLSSVFFLGKSGMVFVPATTAMTGEPDRLSPVSVTPFYIDKYEVTVGQYSKATGIPVAATLDESYPKQFRSEGEIKKYLEATGKSLPTAEQWQLAARGKSGQAYPWGPHSEDDELTNFANVEDRDNEDDPKVRSGGSFKYDYSPAGCYDMAGNLREPVTTDKSREEGRLYGAVLGAGYETRLDKNSCSLEKYYVVYNASTYQDLGLRTVVNYGFYEQSIYLLKLISVISITIAVCLFL
jgi:serine/threonine protein kinase